MVIGHDGMDLPLTRIARLTKPFAAVYLDWGTRVDAFPKHRDDVPSLNRRAPTLDIRNKSDRLLVNSDPIVIRLGSTVPMLPSAFDAQALVDDGTGGGVLQIHLLVRLDVLFDGERS